MEDEVLSSVNKRLSEDNITHFEALLSFKGEWITSQIKEVSFDKPVGTEATGPLLSKLQHDLCEILKQHNQESLSNFVVKLSAGPEQTRITYDY